MKPISYLAIAAIALFNSINAKAQFSTSCLTDSINISTGIDYATGNPYAASPSSASPVLDKYWQITGMPTNTTGLTAPACAQMLLSSLLSTNITPNDSNSRWIAVVANAYETNTAQLSPLGSFFWNCSPNMPYNPTSTPTTFTRSFYVQSTNASESITIDLTKVWGDDYVTLYLDHNTVIYKDQTTSQTGGVAGPSASFNVTPGLHTIEARLWDISGNTSCMRLRASIKSANNVLVSNSCFGLTDSACHLIPVPVDTTSTGTTDTTGTTGTDTTGTGGTGTTGQEGVVSVNQVQASIYTYPNPVKDQLFIQVSKAIPTAVTVYIYNTNGQLVSQRQLKSMSANQSTAIDVQSLPAGMYFMKLYSDKQELISRFAKY
ncbi:T9SS type A sorting domain-containing protein [Taibaiella soli]|uniref:Secretion system C-terminal sorting domain-containing protein n=1 Tax=Taibaiella soli TaxID=1649169 RepID=A0A2W2B351_9BACT|nr:T9SS type A sorting domain-containing protein [Taibaiella soli]PZF74714.1 hypothetical protein DN068_00510 [Taibaiella soli]